jgi:NAD(P)-dependent dehydrogenase (short-subunit alcohol dehydrogenase family)
MVQQSQAKRAMIGNQNRKGRDMEKKTALIVGASRGLGFAIVKEYLARDWQVVATVREKSGTALHELAESSSGHLEVEKLDITDANQILALKRRLQNRTFDLLFVNAGVANDRYETIGEVATEEFVRVMVTNALSPLRIVENFEMNVVANGTIGVMSSGQGSVADNEKGGFEVYHASKAALNTLMRSYAARHAQDPRSLLLIAPGWIRTEMGGPEGRYSVEEAIPRVVDTINAQANKSGLQYLDQFGKAVRW